MKREEAIEEIKRWTPILLTSGQCTEKTSEAQDMAISALSENKGEWDLIQRGRHIDIVCPKCGYVRVESYAYGYTAEEVKDYFNADEDRPNYCENCGCDMRGKA